MRAWQIYNLIKIRASNFRTAMRLFIAGFNNPMISYKQSLTIWGKNPLQFCSLLYNWKEIYFFCSKFKFYLLHTVYRKLNIFKTLYNHYSKKKKYTQTN